MKYQEISRFFLSIVKKKKKNCYIPLRVSNFWKKIYIEYKSNGDRNLKDIINNLKKSHTWKIQITIANTFISSIDNDEVCVMHS